MNARIWILGAGMLSLGGSTFLSLINAYGGFLETFPYALFAPFVGTYPLPLPDDAVENVLTLRLWKYFAACAVVACGIYGFSTRNGKAAAIFVVILVFSWSLLLLRSFV
jgi:hypothetical protein